MNPQPRCWLAVASANHVATGHRGGFMQVCHGKAAPLRRIRAGDGVIYYSPTATFGKKDRLQAFTAAGVVISPSPYQVQMAPDFFPWRHDVRWYATAPVPIAPLLAELEFTTSNPHWGYALRFGLVNLAARDFQCILEKMKAAAENP